MSGQWEHMAPGYFARTCECGDPVEWFCGTVDDLERHIDELERADRARHALVLLAQLFAWPPPFGTIRQCRVCGCLVAGGTTACARCAEAGA